MTHTQRIDTPSFMLIKLSKILVKLSLYEKHREIIRAAACL
jgi:hypothetical protein